MAHGRPTAHSRATDHVCFFQNLYFLFFLFSWTSTRQEKLRKKKEKDDSPIRFDQRGHTNARGGPLLRATRNKTQHIYSAKYTKLHSFSLAIGRIPGYHKLQSDFLEPPASLFDLDFALLLLLLLLLSSTSSSSSSASLAPRRPMPVPWR